MAAVIHQFFVRRVLFFLGNKLLMIMMMNITRASFFHRLLAQWGMKRQVAGLDIRRAFHRMDDSMIEISNEVNQALKNNEPIVALESTIITHGMPYPANLETALKVERTVREKVNVLHNQIISSHRYDALSLKTK